MVLPEEFFMEAKASASLSNHSMREAAAALTVLPAPADAATRNRGYATKTEGLEGE